MAEESPLFSTVPFETVMQWMEQAGCKLLRQAGDFRIFVLQTGVEIHATYGVKVTGKRVSAAVFHRLTEQVIDKLQELKD